MANLANLQAMMEKVKADDAELGLIPTNEHIDKDQDDNFALDDDLLPQAESMPDDEQADIAAKIEAAKADAEQAASERYEARLADALAKQRAELEEKIEASKQAGLENAKRVEEFNQQKREAATKLTATEKEIYINTFGSEDVAAPHIEAEEAKRKRFYDIENEITALKGAPKQSLPVKQLPDGYQDNVDAINGSFSGFHDLAKKLGNLPWSDFTKTDKFKTAAANPEFAMLWKSAFHVEGGTITAAQPVFAGLAQKKLAELLADTKPTGYVAQPGRSNAPKLSLEAVNGNEGVVGRDRMRSIFRSGDQKALRALHKQIH